MGNWNDEKRQKRFEIKTNKYYFSDSKAKVIEYLGFLQAKIRKTVTWLWQIFL